MMLPCAFLIALGFTDPYINIALASIFGGLVFYKVDKKIFGRKNEEGIYTKRYKK